MQDTVVLYPAPGMGHIVSMVELGKLLLRHYHHQFSITILLTTGFWDTNGVTSYINRVTLANPSISFRRFPSISVDTAPTRGPVACLLEFLRLHVPNVLHSLQNISTTCTVRAFVFDLFCTSALPIAKQLNIPNYLYYASGAAALAAFFHFPVLDQQFTPQSYKDLTTTVLHFPAAVPPLRAIQVPQPFLDRDDPSYNEFVYFCSCLALSDGIIVNTFDDLEPIPVKALAEGKCLPHKPTPPIFCVGPLIADTEGNHHDCLPWLDTQPKQSVVFLCFGSHGSFPPGQTKEIARGLEKSGQRFLWVVKRPVFDEKSKRTDADLTNFELEALLPEGFLERVKDRGMVVKCWAPQIQVLSHGSVGGFVTHCGWNSVLETVVAGVPMVAWPLYAEQHLNRNVLVENMQMAIAVEQREGDGFVSGDEVERRVKELMESDKGKELREKSRLLRDKALAALGHSGSSITALAKLVHLWS